MSETIQDRCERYESALARIMAAASEGAGCGVWQCHKLYVMARDAIQGAPVPQNGRLVDGEPISAEVLRFVAAGDGIGAIKQIRAELRLPLKQAKDIYDRLRASAP